MSTTETALGEPAELERLLRVIRETGLPVNQEKLTQAFLFARAAHQGQFRKSGAPFITHCVDVAITVAQLGLKTPALAAALLHDTVEDTPVTIHRIRAEFGEEIALLVDGLTKISRLNFQNRAEFQVENFRKLILAMAKDVRVIIIKLADRLNNMRTLEYLDETAVERIAIETSDIYVPLAHRLGVYLIKTELEDLCFKTLFPHEHETLLDSISMRQEDTQKILDAIRIPIEQKIKEVGIPARVQGRLKSLFSIHQKMQKQNKRFDELYDLLALRIITPEEGDCYRIMGLVHNLYTPLQGRLKDYIAVPKSNQYQSLHTTVMVPNGQVVEIQVRTEQMHQVAEMGIAAHWRYKEGKGTADDLDDKHMVWLRGMADWQNDLSNPDDFMQIFKIDLYHDEVFAFTPKGDLVHLPVGATPLDFAFAIHTDIGLSCAGAKVNNEVVTLDRKLQNGDTVEILLSPDAKPKREWIGFAKTVKAKLRLERWYKREEFRHSALLGRELLERTEGANLDPDRLLALAQKMGHHDTEHLLAALGRGDVRIENVLQKIGGTIPAFLDKGMAVISMLFETLVIRKKETVGVRVQGDENMMIELAGCCQPVPGDHIIGVLASGKGLAVHRTDCPTALTLLERLEQRIPVQWDAGEDQTYTTGLEVQGHDRRNLLLDIIHTLSQGGINILNAAIKTENHKVSDRFQVEVKNLQQLQKTVKKLKRLDGVLKVGRG
jgi:GTP pyrophosphokinase